MAGSAMEKGDRRQEASGLPPVEYTTLALRCPVCHTFFTAEVPVVPEPQGRDTDLRPRYVAVDPLPTLIHACPFCHYTALAQGFDRTSAGEGDDEVAIARRPGDRALERFEVPQDEDLEDLRRWIRRGELVRGLADGRDPFGAERYMLGARILEFLSEDKVYAASDYYLQGAWCARSMGDRALERQCQTEAIERFQQALGASQVPETDRARTLYLVGELSRRLGDFAKAVDLFSQLDSTVDLEEPEGAYFANLGRRQLVLAMVKSDIDAAIPDEDHGLDREDDQLRR